MYDASLLGQGEACYVGLGVRHDIHRLIFIEHLYAGGVTNYHIERRFAICAIFAVGRLVLIEYFFPCSICDADPGLLGKFHAYAACRSGGC